MQRICITLFLFVATFAMSSTVQAQQSEWIPPLPMPMESLFVPYQGHQASSSFAPASRQPLSGRFTGNISGRFASRRVAGTPVAVDSHYGYGNWRYNYGATSRSYPGYPAPVIQEVYPDQPMSPAKETTELPPASIETTQHSTVVDLPMVVPPKSTASPKVVVPPAKPRKMVNEPEKIVKPRKVSEIPPAVRMPPKKITTVLDDVPLSEASDSFIEIEEPEMPETPCFEIETDQAVEEEDTSDF